MHLSTVCVVWLTAVQGLVPSHYVPAVLRDVLQGVFAYAHTDYLEKSADPLIPKAWLPNYIWFRMSLFSEFVIQVPAFVLGMYALWHGKWGVLTKTTGASIPCWWCMERSVGVWLTQRASRRCNALRP